MKLCSLISSSSMTCDWSAILNSWIFGSGALSGLGFLFNNLAFGCSGVSFNLYFY